MSDYIIREKLELNFAQVPKPALKDRNLSLKAKGLYAYLFSLPEDWKVYKTEIVKNHSDGKDSMNAAFKELEVNGYLTAKVIRDEGSKQFKGTILTLRIFPEIKPLRESRDGKPGNGKPVNGQSAPTNTNSTNNVSTNKSLPNGKVGVLPFSSEELQSKRKKFIKPTLEEVNLIIKDKKVSRKFINHYDSNGWMVGKTKMVDWRATANNWVIEIEEKIQQSNLSSPTSIVM